MTGTLLIGDAREQLRTLPGQSVHCCVTSPPYFGLRDYGVDGQMGLEKSPDDYVTGMVELFREVHRVLRDDGTLWLNLGDSYNPNKNLIGIPWRVAFALQSDGWCLRQDIIWSKPNPMPQSVKDRCTSAHEYIFMLTKNPKYYYDAAAIRNLPSEALLKQISDGYSGQDTKNFQVGMAQSASGTKSRIIENARKKLDKQRGHVRQHAGFNARWDNMSREEQMSLGSNKRSVWTVSPKPFKEAHFATYPPDLIEPCILAGSPRGGVVLDPFFGAGTTGVVAQKLWRDFIGIELNPSYVDIARRRLENSPRPLIATDIYEWLKATL